MDDVRHKHEDLIARIEQILAGDSNPDDEHEAVVLGQTLLYETAGSQHPLMATFDSFIKQADWTKARGGCRALILLWKRGALVSPRLQVAKEIEQDIVDVAETQWRAADREKDDASKSLRLSVAAFLCGAAAEDALRRLCIKHSQAFDAGNTSLAKLQSVLYSPSKGVEIISKSENAQIGAWGQTRNNADHGHFAEVTPAEVQSMIVGVRAFIEKHLP